MIFHMTYILYSYEYFRLTLYDDAISAESFEKNKNKYQLNQLNMRHVVGSDN